MRHTVRPNAPSRLRGVACASTVLVVLAGLAASPLPAAAQPYRVVGADGRVTYTDRPPTDARGVTSVAARGASGVAPGAGAGPEIALPFELRQPVARYPVTLYTTGGACDPCTAARQLLRQRGVPFAEKQVVSGEDAEALERLSGGRDAPTLSIGTQIMRGLAPEVWGSYLDAAGYPRESRLPASYPYPPPTPLVERREAAAGVTAAGGRTATAASGAVDPAGTRPVPAAPGGIRF